MEKDAAGCRALNRNYIVGGIYNITKNHIIEQYVPNNSTFMREYESFEEKYISVIASEQELAEYRRIKKASRGKWVGGGFGIKGAVKGAVTAGALNLGASVLHGIGDTISSSVERAKINEKKSQVLQERNWALRFSRDLQDDACGLFIQIAKILNEYHKIELPLLDNAQSSAYLENARKITNYDSKVEILLKSIQSYPYKQGAYFDLTQLLGIFDKELICIMEFFLNDEMLELLIKADHARFSKKYLNYEKDSDEQLDSKISEMDMFCRDTPQPLARSAFVILLSAKMVSIRFALIFTHITPHKMVSKLSTIIIHEMSTYVNKEIDILATLIYDNN